MSIEGGCLCGAVRYSFDDQEPIAVRMCWCRTCRTIAGGNPGFNVMIRTDTLRVEGETAERLDIAYSGNQLRRRFCPKCGTHLFANPDARPLVTSVRTGTLDDQNRYTPKMAIWTENMPDWVVLPEDWEVYLQQPPAPVVRE